MKMRILISNDDGIYSPGILALAKAAAHFGEVRIVAPDVEQSSMGHAITSSRPLRYRRTPIGDFEAYRVNGTPADCVALGAHNWQRVDLVLSGINLGVNLGNACWHSGTLAAAKQAALLGSRGIAVSTSVAGGEPDFHALEPCVAEVLSLLIPERGMPLINVNIPAKARGIRWTRQAVQQYDGAVIRARDPMKRPIYWFTIKGLKGEEEGTDRWAFQHHWVSITPLRLDLTDETALARCVSRSGQALGKNGAKVSGQTNSSKSGRTARKKRKTSVRKRKVFLAER
jgi:5'-nucleotidase